MVHYGKVDVGSTFQTEVWLRWQSPLPLTTVFSSTEGFKAPVLASQ